MEGLSGMYGDRPDFLLNPRTAWVCDEAIRLLAEKKGPMTRPELVKALDEQSQEKGLGYPASTIEDDVKRLESTGLFIVMRAKKEQGQPVFYTLSRAATNRSIMAQLPHTQATSIDLATPPGVHTADWQRVLAVVDVGKSMAALERISRGHARVLWPHSQYLSNYHCFYLSVLGKLAPACAAVPLVVGGRDNQEYLRKYESMVAVFLGGAWKSPPRLATYRKELIASELIDRVPLNRETRRAIDRASALSKRETLRKLLDVPLEYVAAAQWRSLTSTPDVDAVLIGQDRYELYSRLRTQAAALFHAREDAITGVPEILCLKGSAQGWEFDTDPEYVFFELNHVDERINLGARIDELAKNWAQLGGLDAARLDEYLSELIMMADFTVRTLGNKSPAFGEADKEDHERLKENLKQLYSTVWERIQRRIVTNQASTLPDAAVHERT